MKIHRKTTVLVAEMVAEGCCSVASLSAFRKKLREHVHEVPNWTSVLEQGYLHAYDGMLKASGFCSCKLIALGERMGSTNIWETILGLGTFSLIQRRSIGVLSGMWPQVLQLGPIFSNPLSRPEVLAYAREVNDDRVWEEALKTGVLNRRDVRELMKRKSSRDHWGLSVPIIRTGLLTDKEVLKYLRSLENYRIDPAVEHAKLRNYKSDKLMAFALAVKAMYGNFRSMRDFWIPILEHGKHGLSRKKVLAILDEDIKLHRQDPSHVEPLTVAVIGTGLLNEVDLSVIRGSGPSKRVLEAILDLRLAAA